MQEPEPLGTKEVVHGAHAGHVAARMPEAFDQVIADRVGADVENNRDGCRRRLGGEHGRGGVEPRDHLDLAAHQVGREYGQAIVMALPPAVLDREIGALDKAALLEAAMECCQPVHKRAERLADQNADHRGCWLLRVCRDRPRRCTT